MAETIENNNPTIKHNVTFLKDYAPPPFLITTANLRFLLDPKETYVKSELHISRNPNSKNTNKEIKLNGINLDLQEIKINQQILPSDRYQVTAEYLIISETPDDFILDTTVKINPQANLAYSGLYLSNNNFCTQNEPHGFRKITYFIDRPDILTKFTTTIIADKNTYPVLLSNGNLINSQKLNNNQHQATWFDPFPKSPYLFALVAGNFSWIEDQHITKSQRQITLRIFSEPQHLAQCHYAMQFLKQAMQWEEENFGLEYDLDLYQIVSIDDFNFGAMENKGLNIFNSNLLLASPATATDSDCERIAAVVAHEYFHNWTGNRITCRDWFQIGLKEGLTTLREQLFMEDLYGQPINRIDAIKTIYNRQFPEDAGPLSHPIRLQSYIEVDNFYTTTVYDKSAEISRLLITIFGKDKFKQIMQTFLSKFDGQAATIEDFLQVVASLTNIDVEQFKLWYDQNGTPQLNISDSFSEEKKYQLTIQQYHKKTQKDFYIPLTMSLINSRGDNTPTKTLLIRQKEQVFHFENFSEKPLPSLLRNFSAPVKINYPYNDNELLFLVCHDQDPISRWRAGQKLAQNTIMQLCNSNYQQEKIKLPEILIQMFKNILTDEQIDGSLATEMLQLPTESYLLDTLKSIDPEDIHYVREHLKTELAIHLKHELLSCYNHNNIIEPYSFTAAAINRRALKNICLYYLMHLNTQEVFAICHHQLEQADNLTDSYAALNALANSLHPQREQILEDYYQKWQNQPNLVTKWLVINANIKLSGNLQRVQQLLNHPAFNAKNPNKVYALIRSFCENNLINFHLRNGDGYDFLTAQILATDKFNPNLAAAIVVPLTYGHKLDQARRELLRQQLLKISIESGLSKNVYEIVTKAL